MGWWPWQRLGCRLACGPERRGWLQWPQAWTILVHNIPRRVQGRSVEDLRTFGRPMESQNPSPPAVKVLGLELACTHQSFLYKPCQASDHMSSQADLQHSVGPSWIPLFSAHTTQLLMLGSGSFYCRLMLKAAGTAPLLRWHLQQQLTQAPVSVPKKRISDGKSCPRSYGYIDCPPAYEDAERFSCTA